MILIAGATGFVGRALLDELAERDRTQVRALVRRDFDAVRLRDRGIDAVTGDLVTGAGLDPAMRGVKTFVYLAHTADRPGDLVDNDLTAVQNATLAARAAGAERIVYLGPIAASEAATLACNWLTPTPKPTAMDRPTMAPKIDLRRFFCMGPFSCMR